MWFLMWPCLRHIVCTSSLAVSIVPMDPNCVLCPKNISYWCHCGSWCGRHAYNVRMMCGWHESEILLEIWLADDICHLDIIRTSSTDNSSRDDMYIHNICISKKYTDDIDNMRVCRQCVETKLWIIRYMRSGKDDNKWCVHVWTTCKWHGNLCICVDNVQKLSCT